MTGLDDEQKMTVATGIRRAVDARRRGQRQPTATQERGKRECLTTEEVKKKGTASTGARQESVFHRRGKGGARSARMAGAIHGKKKERLKKRAEKSGENRRRGGERKMKMSGCQWRLTWRQVAHTSRTLTRKTRLRIS